MKIGIVGGGASGMISAYLLNKDKHDITVIEKKSSLGGHICTSQKNFTSSKIKGPLKLEAGVIEFSARFYKFRELMKELEVNLIPVDIGTGLFTKKGKSFLSKIMIDRNRQGIGKISAILRLYSLQFAAINIWWKTKHLKKEDLFGKSMSDFTGKENILNDWLKCFSMYSYSIPFDKIAGMPAALTLPSIKDYMLDDWYRIEGGVYSYIEKILERFNGKIVLDARIKSIETEKKSVNVTLVDGKQYIFDKLIFATAPDQVLQLLKNPDTTEKKMFSQWKANHIQTVIHTDTDFYKKYNIKKPSAFDFFQTKNGWAYNAYLNQLCDIDNDDQTSYFLAFNMEEYIRTDKILHIQKHHTPFYTTEAYDTIQDIIRNNGRNKLYYAGAYLGDGLHEGAVNSAQEVVRRIQISN